MFVVRAKIKSKASLNTLVFFFFPFLFYLVPTTTTIPTLQEIFIVDILCSKFWAGLSGFNHNSLIQVIYT